MAFYDKVGNNDLTRIEDYKSLVSIALLISPRESYLIYF